MAVVACWRLLGPVRLRATGSMLWSAVRSHSSQSSSQQQGLVVKTSLSSPPWPVFKLPDPVEETKYHTEVVQRVNEMIATGQYGRLFAVVHLASKQWKVTSEDLILMENFLPAECGDRIRLEKVLLVGADDFTLIGKPLLGKDLVRVEATVIEKTESWPKINMKFWKRHSYRKKKGKMNTELSHSVPQEYREYCSSAPRAPSMDKAAPTPTTDLAQNPPNSTLAALSKVVFFRFSSA
uniref:Large ribosomal subunit protein bL21m n=1 Tax=Crocodylus porosus TaxID=8502 RepID=A0A7M4ESB4_CROPO